MTAESSSLMCCVGSRSRDTWLAAAARCGEGCSESRRLSQLYHGRVVVVGGGGVLLKWMWNIAFSLQRQICCERSLRPALWTSSTVAKTYPATTQARSNLSFSKQCLLNLCVPSTLCWPIFCLSIRCAVSLISRWACNMITWPSLVSYEDWTSFSSKIRQSRQHKRLVSARPSMLQHSYTVQVFSPCTHTGANPEVWVLHLHSSTRREGLQPVESCHCHS